MVTFAQAASNQAARWVPIITIEGSGAYGGIYKYCPEVPLYAVGNDLYRPWLASWPNAPTQKINIETGLPETGEIEFEIQDRGGLITSEFRIAGDPTYFLSAAIDHDDTSITLSRTTGIVTGTTVLFIGNEAMRVVSGSNPYTVTRAQLDTVGAPHKQDAPVYVALPSIIGRRIRLYLAPYDGDSAATETPTHDGVYVCDKFDPVDNSTAYAFGGKGKQKWIRRLVNRRKPYRGRIESVNPDGSGYSASRSDDPLQATSLPYWPGKGAAFHLLRTNESWFWYPVGTNESAIVGFFGTQQEARPGDDFEVIFPADDDPSGRFYGLEPTFFRFSPGPSPSASRSSGTWNRSSHWIDIILNLLTSSATPSDVLELANRNTTYGAWDCLPIGIGIGVPHAEIDFVALLSLLREEPSARFPGFVVPREPVEFGELISETFLRPIGAYLTTAGGLARIVKIRPPLAGTVGAVLGPSQILARPVGDLLYEDPSDLSYDHKVITTIRAEFRDHVFVINNEELGGTNFGADTVDSDEGRIDLKIASGSEAYGQSLRLPGWANRAFMTRLALNRKARIGIKTQSNLSLHAVNPGDYVDTTHERVPNPNTGTIGVTSASGMCLEKRLRIDPRSHGVWYDLRLALFPGVRVGKIAPSARIASVSDAAGTPDVTVSANRYTKSDVVGAAATDAACFTVNDVVMLKNRDGTFNNSATTTITGISGNVITLAGNPASQLSNGTGNAGMIIEYAPRATAVSQQYDRFVYWADKVDLTVGASSQTPWRYV